MTKSYDYFESRGLPLSIVGDEIHNESGTAVGRIRGGLELYALATEWMESVYDADSQLARECQVFSPGEIRFETDVRTITISNMSREDGDAVIGQDIYIVNDTIFNKNGGRFINDTIVAFSEHHRIDKEDLPEGLSELKRETSNVCGLALRNRNEITLKLEDNGFASGYPDGTLIPNGYQHVQDLSNLTELVKPLGSVKLDSGQTNLVESVTPDNLVVDFQEYERLSDGKHYILTTATGLGPNREGSLFIDGTLATVVNDEIRAIQMIPKDSFLEDAQTFLSDYETFRSVCKECNQTLADDVRSTVGKDPVITMDDLEESEGLVL